MERILAQGHQWQITHNTFTDRVCLSLISEYGTVEFVPKDLRTLEILESIEREYNKLKEQGPLKRDLDAEIRHVQQTALSDAEVDKLIENG